MRSGGKAPLGEPFGGTSAALGLCVSGAGQMVGLFRNSKVQKKFNYESDRIYKVQKKSETSLNSDETIRTSVPRPRAQFACVFKLFSDFTLNRGSFNVDGNGTL